MFDPLKNTWERLPDMATKHSGCTAKGRNLCDVEVLDTSTMRWEEDHDVPSLNTGRCEHGATTVGNRIYVVGGRGDSGRLDTMEILEVQEAPQPSQPDLAAEIAKLNAGIAKRDAEIAKLRTQIAQKRAKIDLEAEIAKRDSEIAKLWTQIARVNTTSTQEPSPNTETSQPDYSEFKTRIDLEAVVATLRKQYRMAMTASRRMS